MTAKAPQFFAFYPQAFAGDGKVEAMSTVAVGAYILLICKAWHEHPAGTLPDDDALLARWSRINIDTWVQIRAEVMAAFTFANGRWIQKRLAIEYRKAKQGIKAKSEAGKKGMAKRWGSYNSVIADPITEPNYQTRPEGIKNLARPEGVQSPRDLAGWLAEHGVGEPSRSVIAGAETSIAALERDWAESREGSVRRVPVFVSKVKKRLGISKRDRGIAGTINGELAKLNAGVLAVRATRVTP